MMKLLFALPLLAVPAMASAKMTGAQYVAKAGASDQYEIQSSRLVLATTPNDRLRGFADEMVKDHMQSTADVKAAAMKAGMKSMPPVLNPMQSTMIANLTKVSGTARDQMYIEQQKAAHHQALAVHEDYSVNGTSAPLKAVASNVVPVVKTHIQMLAAM